MEMGVAVRITCISTDGGNHAEAHEGITHYGWVNEQTGTKGTSTRREMIAFLEVKGRTAYVKDSQGNVADIAIQKSACGDKYLRTRADQTWTDNLLALPEC